LIGAGHFVVLIVSSGDTECAAFCLPTRLVPGPAVY